MNEKAESSDSEIEDDFVFMLLNSYPENTSAELNAPLTTDELLSEFKIYVKYSESHYN